MPKHAPEKQASSAVSAFDLIAQAEEKVRADINKAQQFIQASEEYLNKLAAIRGGIPSQERPTTGLFRYVNMRFIDAICLYLERTQRPWTREHLVGEVIDGGVYTGKGDRAKGDAIVQANKSLGYFLMTRKKKDSTLHNVTKAANPKLRQVGELIGLALWPDEKFLVSWD